MAEWAWVLRESSGVIVLRNAYRDTSAIDEATQLYQGIIADEKMKMVVAQIISQQQAQMIEYGIHFKIM